MRQEADGGEEVEREQQSKDASPVAPIGGEGGPSGGPHGVGDCTGVSSHGSWSTPPQAEGATAPTRYCVKAAPSEPVPTSTRLSLPPPQPPGEASTEGTVDDAGDGGDRAVVTLERGVLAEVGGDAARDHVGGPTDERACRRRGWLADERVLGGGWASNLRAGREVKGSPTRRSIGASSDGGVHCVSQTAGAAASSRAMIKAAGEPVRSAKRPARIAPAIWPTS